MMKITQKERILIVDDDNQYRSLTAAFLKEEGYGVHETSSLNHALEIMKTDESLHVMIVDLNLRNSPGRSFIKKLKDQSKKYRIIIYTASEKIAARDKPIEPAIFHCLLKGNKRDLKFAVDQAFQDMKVEELTDFKQRHLRIQRTMAAGGEEKTLLDLICEETLRHVGAHSCHIRVLDFEKGDYELRGYSGPPALKAALGHNKHLDEIFSGKLAEKHLYQNVNVSNNVLEYRSREEEMDREAFENIRSAYVIPITTGFLDNDKRIEAIFSVSSTEKEFFSSENVQVIDDFVTQAAVAISTFYLKARRTNISLEYKKTNSLLVKVNEAVRESDVPRIFETVLKGIAQIIRAELVTIFLYNENTRRIENYAETVSGKLRQNGDEHYVVGKGLTGQVFQKIESIQANRKSSNPEFDREVILTELPSGRIENFLAVPLVIRRKVLGVIRVINKKSSYYDMDFPFVKSEIGLLPGGFSNEDQSILQIIAAHLATTIENAELIRMQKGRIAHLNSLAQVAQRISANYGLETPSLLRMIVSETAQAMDATICMLFLKDSEQKRVVLAECYGIPPIQDAFYELGESHAGLAAKSGKPVLINNIGEFRGKYDSEILKRLKDIYHGEPEISSLMIVPITIWADSPFRNNEIIGVLKVINIGLNSHRFGGDDLDLFQTFASQIGIALAMSERNKSLFHLVQGVGHEIQNSVSLARPLVIEAKEALDTFSASFKDYPLSDENLEPLLLVKDILDIIYQAADGATEFTQDLLGFSDSRFQRRQLIDLNDVIEKEMNKLRNNPPPSIVNIDSVDVRFVFSEEPLRCHVFEVPFAHIIRNIVANAYQAMEKERGVLTIRTYQKSHQSGIVEACIEIIDSGIGISKHHISQIFDARFTMKSGGNGLGLWLVKIALLRMDGDVSVKSTLGQGSTFLLRLPMSSRSK